jgi:hypothetical protein
LGKSKNRRPGTLEGRVLKALELNYTPGRAVKLGFALIALGLVDVWYGVFPFYGLGLLFWTFGVFSASRGILDWFELFDKVWLKRAMKQAAKEISYGT